MADLRALTLTPEWAWAVCYLDKRVENRTWPAPAHIIGQRIAIHAGMKAPDWGGVELMARCAGWRLNRTHIRDLGLMEVFSLGERSATLPRAHRLTRGAIVATAIVYGYRAVAQRDAVGWEAGPWCWDLVDVQVLATPVPCKGVLKLWRVPVELAEAVLRG